MVSFWPFGRGDDNSLDSFERILSKLASQIQTETSRLALLRQHLRRYKGLFTIYTSVAYIFYVVVIVLVVGWREIGPPQIGGFVGGPAGIWSVRKLLALYYNSRISTTETRLEDLQARQRDTVEKLKAATKFSTTQSIIEKYGGGSVSSSGTESKTIQHQQQQEGPQGPHGHPDNQQLRQRPQGQPSGAPPPVPTTPQQIQQQLVQQQLLAQQRVAQQQPLRAGTNNPNPVRKSNPPAPIPVLNLPQTTTQPSSRQHIPEEPTSPRWYDRVLDVLVGEDETSAKNRYALICENCRMVNGLAPSGTRGLEDMERWGCARCGTMNGRAPSRPPSMKGEEEEMDTTPNLEVKKSGGRKTRSPTPSENIKTTGSKVKKEVAEVESESTSGGEDSLEEDGSEKEEEDVPEPPGPSPKGKVTRGNKKT